ncbi:MAG: hypothetical protein K0R09_2941 [Clostridiales bacterium]|jgi:hypothetical protein|nr:hypothetical protein [Clostridiales bacterium]
MLSIPNYGPAMLKHNEMIIEANSYCYFKNRDTEELNVADTATGPYIIAYTDQTLAEKVYNNIFSNEYDIQRIDNVDMLGFYDSIKQKGNGWEEISGIVLNLPVDFITGEDNLIYEGELPLHLFAGEELTDKSYLS